VSPPQDNYGNKKIKTLPSAKRSKRRKKIPLDEVVPPVEEKEQTLETLKLALTYLHNGLSVFPLRYGDKRPAIKSWKEYQVRRPTEEEVDKWFSKKLKNIAIVCGRVSGGLVVIDFDSEEVFKEWLEKAPEEIKCLTKWTWIVKTGKGYHVYFIAPEEVRTKPRLKEGLDIKAEGGYVVAPPSLHPSGKHYEFVQGPPITNIYRLNREEWNKIKESLGWEEEEKKVFEIERKAKELTNQDILEIAEIIKNVYRKGYRRLLFIALSGWFYKAGVKRKVLERLAEICYENDVNEDREAIYREILKIIQYQYERRLPELEKRGAPILGKGKARVKGQLEGVQEILEEVLGEERALATIKRIEEILGVASPYKSDSVFELLDYKKNLYALANLRSKITARVEWTDNGIIYRERIMPVAPVEITVYVNPFGGITQYEILFEGIRTLRLGPAPIEDIIARLKAEGLVYHSRLVADVLSALVNGFIRKGRAVIKEEIESPGFYIIENELVCVKWTPKKVDEIDRKELREALELLNQLHNNWYGHAKERFATLIKWFIIAPFIYVYKQKGKWVEWLYLHGTSRSGKTTMAEIGLKIWGLGHGWIKAGTSIDTVPRLGYVLGQGTFPTLINEPGGALSREDIKEAIKNSVENTIARGRYVRGTYTEMPALSPLCFTANVFLPNDDALLRRLIVLRFTFGDREKVKEREQVFDKEIKPQLDKLSIIGYCAFILFSDNWKRYIEIGWKRASEEILTLIYKWAGLKAPKWIKEWQETPFDIYEEYRESIRSYLVKRINEEYSRHIGRVVVEDRTGITNLPKADIDLETRIKIVLSNQLLPFAFLKYDKDGTTVIFTSSLTDELRKVIGDIGGLKSIAELLGWEYKLFRIKNKVVKGAGISLEEFIEFLSQGD